MAGLTSFSKIATINSAGQAGIIFNSLGQVAGQIFEITTITLSGGGASGIASFFVNGELIGQSQSAGIDVGYATSPTRVGMADKLQATFDQCVAGEIINVKVEGFLANA